jgi:hypothetical protein
MSDFDTELLKLLKKYNIPSLDKLCYNDPELVKKYNSTDLDDYTRRFKEWEKENPAPECTYGNADSWRPLYSAWREKRDAEIGPDPDDLLGDLVPYSYGGNDFIEGIWYSSAC